VEHEQLDAAAAGLNGLPDAAAAAEADAAEAEAKAAEDAAPKPEDVMRAFASAKVRCVAVLSFVWFNYLFVRGGGQCWGLVSVATRAMDAAAAAAGPDGQPDAAAAAAEAKAAEESEAPRPEDVMRAFASAKVRCGAVSVCRLLGVLVLWFERWWRTIGAAAAAAAAAEAAAEAEAKAAEDAAPRPEDVMRAFASAKVRCGAFMCMFFGSLACQC
jgi:hypothetical protein